MKYHDITSEQAAYIWKKNGMVYKYEIYSDKFTTKKTIVRYTAADFTDAIPGMAEKREINKFSKRADYPA